MRNIFFFLLFLSFTFTEIFAQFNWPMVNGGPTLSSYAKEETELKPPLRVDRNIAITKSQYFSVKDDLLIIGKSSTPNSIVAVNLSTGSEIWSFEIPNTAGGIGCIPAITENLVLVGGQHSAGLYALNKNDGTQVWLQPIGSLYIKNPVVSDGKVYIIQDSLYCFNLTDGTPLWTYPISGQLTPAVDDNNVYVAGKAGVVLDKLTGTKKYDLFTKDMICVLDDQNIYVNRDTNITAIKKENGSIVWETPRLGGNLPFINGGAIAISDKYICYVIWKNGEEKGEIYVHNKSDGTYVWSYTFSDEGVFTPRIANGIVYVLNWKPGELWGFNITDGSVVLHDSTLKYKDRPIIADHALIINTADEIVVFKSEITDVEKGSKPSLPTLFELGNNYPNPFNPSTIISYSIPEAGFVSLKIYDLKGEEVTTLVNEEKSAGKYRLEFNAEGLSSGTYFYKLQSGNFSQTKKMILLR